MQKSNAAIQALGYNKGFLTVALQSLEDGMPSKEYIALGGIW
jgi:hypothetical protein